MITGTFGDCGYDRNVIPFRADIVRGGYDGDVDIYFPQHMRVWQIRAKDLPFFRPTCDCGIISCAESLLSVYATGCVRMQIALSK